MSTVFYKKVGRRYVPSHVYDPELLDSFPEGAHLVMCYPGGKSRKFNIDPALAPMIAAGQVAGDAMVNALIKASEMRPPRLAMSAQMQEAWENLISTWGDDARMLHYDSAATIAEAGMRALAHKAAELLENPAVKTAYDHFMLVCKLSQDAEQQTK